MVSRAAAAWKESNGRKHALIVCVCVCMVTQLTRVVYEKSNALFTTTAECAGVLAKAYGVVVFAARQLTKSARNQAEKVGRSVAAVFSWDISIRLTIQNQYFENLIPLHSFKIISHKRY